MPRPKTFDPDVALDSAMRAFWSRGFAATTVQDLVDSTGLGRGSLYNTFPSKEQIFRSALLHYDEVQTTPQIEMLGGEGSLRDRIRALLTTVVDEETTRGETTQGCFAVNSALELADRDPAVRDLVTGIFARVHTALREAIQRAQREGEASAATPADDLAMYVLNVMYGLRVTGKTVPRDALLRVVDLTLLAI